MPLTVPHTQTSPHQTTGLPRPTQNIDNRTPLLRRHQDTSVPGSLRPQDPDTTPGMCTLAPAGIRHTWRGTGSASPEARQEHRPDRPTTTTTTRDSGSVKSCFVSVTRSSPEPPRDSLAILHRTALPTYQLLAPGGVPYPHAAGSRRSPSADLPGHLWWTGAVSAAAELKIR